MTQRTCPFNPGNRVWGYGRDSGGINQQESVASQRRAIEEYCHRHRLVLVYFLPTRKRSARRPWAVMPWRTCCTWPSRSPTRWRA